MREDTTYQWFQSNGEWKIPAHHPRPADHQRQHGHRRRRAGAAGAGAALWHLSPDHHRSQVGRGHRPIRFYSGWAASSAGDRPDRIPVAADKPTYAPGAVAHVRIKPDGDGKALVVVAGDRVFSSKLIDAPASGATVDIPVSADWGAGAYVLVTDYRPLARVQRAASRCAASASPGWASTMRRAP